MKACAAASKYCAVKFLQKYWNISQEETLTIGDHIHPAQQPA